MKTNEGFKGLRGFWSEELDAYVMFRNQDIVGAEEVELWHPKLDKFKNAVHQEVVHTFRPREQTDDNGTAGVDSRCLKSFFVLFYE
ncbi:hypothetical protein EXIGUO9Y_90003 [Exiguobacterium oxidotolerans]|uniref:Uncharacterized protein n=1 Tax=Exiguobacterium oxidotolerans TaxID=223958 RepID=A0A653IHR0_9BACL|nr:hypothetical protein EXIGUO9Y_90003 [Exiguobacterium oxidotolerans]